MRVTATGRTAPVPIVTDHGGFRYFPDHALRPRRIQPVAATVTPAGADDHPQAPVSRDPRPASRKQTA
ncbi:hypothetical protein GCM10009787_28020 [Streptomyces bangladeshensis]|uniref:Uncharacterized protein n=1 Tax=Streptomyces bangladeshensis TaxID=295352 RepID=A0ABP5N8P1_9ACTN